MKKKIGIFIGVVCSLLGVAILIPAVYYFVLTETIVLDGMPAPDIQEQIDIYAELGYCTSGYDNGEDIEIQLTRHQRQKWIQDAQKDLEFFLEEANDLDNMRFEISGDRKTLTLIANENLSFRSAGAYLTALVYNMQLYQVLNREEDWGIHFILKDMGTNEILYTTDLPEEKIKFNEETWEQ